jgi:hypothetical protein
MQMSELEEVKQNLNKLIDDSFAKLKVELLAELRKKLQELLESQEPKKTNKMF